MQDLLEAVLRLLYNLTFDPTQREAIVKAGMVRCPVACCTGFE